VTGCLGSKKDLILEKHPEVLSVSGAHAYEEVVKAVREHCPQEHDPFIDLLPPQGIKLTPRHYAYLKIAEGCHHKCRFCIIPQFRGTLVSRPIDEVLLEAERLSKAGVKECLVISQDTSAYGLDLRYTERTFRSSTFKTNFYDLARGLGDLNMWIRMHYVYPYPHVDHVIPLMAEGAILPYLDIPFQHADPDILKAMRRPANAENVIKRIHEWRNICPDITLRSTFIVGFPGETESAFQRLLDFLSEAQLDRVGCFAYSPVEGATANDLPNHVPEEIKQERRERFMLHQSKISTHKLAQKVGREIDVIIDEVHPDQVIARSKGDAPEIDGLVLIEPHASLKQGHFAKVTITASNEHDLFARIVN
jgi:ribosomal protein S12 methylthiotransferase